MTKRNRAKGDHESDERLHKRDEVLSVKTSTEEKAMIIMAAKKYGMTYSDFVRQMALGACANAGIGPADVAEEVMERSKVKGEMRAEKARLKKAAGETESDDRTGDVPEGESVPVIAA